MATDEAALAKEIKQKLKEVLKLLRQLAGTRALSYALFMIEQAFMWFDYHSKIRKLEPKNDWMQEALDTGAAILPGKPAKAAKEDTDEEEEEDERESSDTPDEEESEETEEEAEEEEPEEEEEEKPKKKVVSSKAGKKGKGKKAKVIDVDDDEFE